MARLYIATKREGAVLIAMKWLKAQRTNVNDWDNWGETTMYTQRKTTK